MADAGHGGLADRRWGQPPDIAGTAPDPHEISAAIDLALQNADIDGIDHFFPTPFELERLRGNARLREKLMARIAENLLVPAYADGLPSIEAMQIPKSGPRAYRRGAWIEPVDLLTYLTCAILIASRLEPTRVSVQRVFSHRFNPHAGRLFGERYDFGTFQAAVRDRLEAKPGTVLVSTDVADCYDSMCGERLAQSLARRGAEPWLVAAVDRLLRGWRGPEGKGLPAGSHASHILAEAVFAEIDDRLQKDGIDYVRYVDDYRLFAPDVATARAWLQRLDERLALERLHLNQSKTSLQALTGEQYERASRIRRAGLLWGKLGRDRILSVAQGTPQLVPQPPANPPAPSAPDSAPQNKFPPLPGRPRNQLYDVVLRYRKTPLQREDAELIRGIDAQALLADLKRRAAQDAYVPLGELRLLVEATLATKSYARFPEILDLLAASPHGAIFVADVLETCRDEIPKPVRSAAAKWYAARLLEGAFPGKFEALQAALLLGTDGYEAPQVLREYLEAKAPASSLVQRTLIESLRNHCDKHLAQALLVYCDRAAPQTRRVLLDVVWPHLEAAQRSVLARRYAEEAQRDPFVAALFEAAGTSGEAPRALA